MHLTRATELIVEIKKYTPSVHHAVFFEKE